MGEIKIGQILYREKPQRNAAPEIIEYTVTKIATKYIHIVDKHGNIKLIDKERLRYEDKVYSQANFQLYRTEQEIFDKRELGSCINKIKKAFDFYSTTVFTLEQLKKVVEILGL